MIKFIFFGRLVYEKGIDSVIEAFSLLAKGGVDNWFLEIYGEGNYEEKCEAFASAFPRNVLLHGRAPQQTITHTLQGSHYCIMPSRVIESFGMSALESLDQGVPVIGSKTGGLDQFIDDEYDINQIALHKILHECIDTFSIEKRKEESRQAKEKAKKYTKEKRLKIVEHESNTKRTLIISDYTSKIGGVESILFAIKKALEKEGSSVEMIGWRIRKDTNQGLKRKLGLLATALNLPFLIHIHNEIREKKPTLIRLHSVNRLLGRLPIAGIRRRKKAQVRCTIHDLGMFHPFGADVRSLNDIPSFSLAGFTGITESSFKKVLIALKFANVRMIKNQLKKKVDIRTVPSAFMVEVLHQKRHIPKEKILVLPHFIG